MLGKSVVRKLRQVIHILEPPLPQWSRLPGNGVPGEVPKQTGFGNQEDDACLQALPRSALFLVSRELVRQLVADDNQHSSCCRSAFGGFQRSV